MLDIHDGGSVCPTDSVWSARACDRGDVDPTNNHGERELRAFVLRRKTSLGTQSERGNHFAARMMTVAHTAKKQGKNVFDFVAATYQATCAGAKRPSLFV